MVCSPNTTIVQFLYRSYKYILVLEVFYIFRKQEKKEDENKDMEKGGGCRN